MSQIVTHRTRAQESRAAIERMYTAMRHLFNRGVYKPMGVSGEAIIDALMILRPEIYGSIADPERVELDGLFYVFERLPIGIEECRFVKLVSREGFENTHFPPIISVKRRRNCYRIDKEQMFIEVTRGRSDIYDVLTHLTFMYIEAEKIRRNSQSARREQSREWYFLEEIIKKEEKNEPFSNEIAFTYLSTILGRTYDETAATYKRFNDSPNVNSLFRIIHWLGKLSLQEFEQQIDREITFSSALREKVGNHIYGEIWAKNLKAYLKKNNLLGRPIHLISANLHSVMNTIFGASALGRKKDSIFKIAADLSLEENGHLRDKVIKFALNNGMLQLDDFSGTNINVQIFDTTKIKEESLLSEIGMNKEYISKEQPVILVVDYAFGEQAFETMDELLKNYEENDTKIPLDVKSISIMGKAGILKGKKGDIIIPYAHIFEGTADNYPFENNFKVSDFEMYDTPVFDGSMITVLGTSLQNKDILTYFKDSSWKAVGIEMEGAHFQKAIQSASKIRNSIDPDVKLRYAFYASDNPLISGQTLASGSLGLDGVKPTYIITIEILKRIFNNS